MSDLPVPVERLADQIGRLPGVKEVGVQLQPLDGVTAEDLILPGESAFLPHALLRRTHGGRPGEVLVTVEVWFSQTHAGWVAVEFLAWWVRDLSRAGHDVQMRPIGLPPVAWGTQLGRTLRFLLEFVFQTDGDDIESVTAALGDFADSLKAARRAYREAIKRPTRADWPDAAAALKSANRNDAEAMIHLGRLCQQGDELPEDDAAAADWFRQAAELGHPQGQVHLGRCYAEGAGVPTDAAKAVELYRAAAEAGLPLAMALLGQCYEDGEGVNVDHDIAADWYRQGADYGDPVCLAQIGDCYEHGRGVPRDLTLALSYFEEAYDEGFVDVAEAVERVRKLIALEG